MEFSFRVPHKPKPKGRPRLTRRGRAYTPKATVEHEQAIAQAYKDAEGPFFDGPIQVEVEYTTEDSYITITDGVGASRVRADIDNLVKATLDGLQGTAFDNDKQVVALYAFKEQT